MMYTNSSSTRYQQQTLLFCCKISLYKIASIWCTQTPSQVDINKRYYSAVSIFVLNTVNMIYSNSFSSWYQQTLLFCCKYTLYWIASIWCTQTPPQVDINSNLFFWSDFVLHLCRKQPTHIFTISCWPVAEDLCVPDSLIS